MKKSSSYPTNDPAKSNPPKAGFLSQVEFFTAILLTALIVVLHFTVLGNAGALWRDETNSVNLAAKPSIAEIWQNLEYDSSPIFASLVLRTWMSLGLESDFRLRILGFFIGLLVLAAIWFTVRQAGVRAPLVSLILFAFNPLVIRYVDSIRPHGLGTLFIILALIAIRQVVRHASFFSITLAGIAAVLSVQTLYHNLIILTGIICAAIIIVAIERRWRTFIALSIVQLVATLSILPYIYFINQNTLNFELLSRSAVDLSVIFTRIAQTINSSAGGFQYLWILFLLLATGIVVNEFQASIRAKRAIENDRNNNFFFLVTIFSIVLFLGFLRILGVQTQPWYYLPLFAVIALCLDVLVSGTRLVTSLRILLVLMAAVITFNATMRSCQLAYTNIDVVAATLSDSSQGDDFIILNPWYIGISFLRYYHGSAPFMTIPNIEDLSIHRYDLVKSKMAGTAPLEPIFKKISTALSAGHTVWLVGYYPTATIPYEIEPLPPAPNSPYGWSADRYQANWVLQVMYYLQRKGHTITIAHGPTDGFGPYENVFLFKVN